MSTRLPLEALLLGALLFSTAGSTPADEPSAGKRCTRLVDGAARLACYDAAYGAHAAAPASVASGAPIAPATPAAIVAAPRPTPEFGDNGQLRPSVEARAKIPKKLDAKVVSAAPLAGGLYRLRLDNGELWETRQANFGLDFKASDAVAISRMAFGGYQISLAGQGRSVGVKRIE